MGKRVLGTAACLLFVMAVLAVLVAIREGMVIQEEKARFRRSMDSVRAIFETLKKNDRVAHLRWIFGDLGLAILGDPDDIEPLRADEATRRLPPDVPGRRLGAELAHRVGKAILDDATFDEVEDFCLEADFKGGLRFWRRGEHIDVWYAKGGTDHFDVFAVVTDWKGRIVHPKQHEHCMDSNALTPLVRELEQSQPTRTNRPEEQPLPR